MPGAMMPGFYNHNYHILQSPGYVVIALEILHDVRVISLDGRPHIAQGIAQWLGDSRGRWEGDTLVVETTNVANKVNEFRRSHTVLGASRHLRLVERFRGSDFRDGDLFVSAFADDAVFNVGQRTISGREELTAYRVERHAGQTGDTGVRHWTNGWRIVPTADGAEARVYWMVVDVGTGKPFTDRSGYYNDTYVKTVDGWRIKNRTINFDRAG